MEPIWQGRGHADARLQTGREVVTRPRATGRRVDASPMPAVKSTSLTKPWQVDTFHMESVHFRSKVNPGFDPHPYGLNK